MEKNKEYHILEEFQNIIEQSYVETNVYMTGFTVKGSVNKLDDYSHIHNTTCKSYQCSLPNK
jgi:sRNA-binding regulator protein Hfq